MYYVISDTHFGHEKMYIDNGRSPGFENTIIHNTQNTVGEGDVLIHLGDVTFYNEAFWTRQFCECHKAKNWLVKGNHDGKSDNWYLDHGFDFVARRFQTKMFGKKLLFTHIPEEGLTDVTNIHGHLHNDEHRAGQYQLNENNVLVQIESTLGPVSLQKLLGM